MTIMEDNHILNIGGLEGIIAGVAAAVLTTKGYPLPLHQIPTMLDPLQANPMVIQTRLMLSDATNKLLQAYPRIEKAYNSFSSSSKIATAAYVGYMATKIAYQLMG